METTILDELLKIPADATSAVVMGVTMQVIDPVQAQKMLNSDPEDKHVHEWPVSWALCWGSGKFA